MSDKAFGYYTVTSHITVTADSEQDAEKILVEIHDMFRHMDHVRIDFSSDKPEFIAIPDEQ